MEREGGGEGGRGRVCMRERERERLGEIVREKEKDTKRGRE